MNAAVSHQAAGPGTVDPAAIRQFLSEFAESGFRMAVGPDIQFSAEANKLSNLGAEGALKPGALIGLAFDAVGASFREVRDLFKAEAPEVAEPENETQFRI
jgi:hypothetical protein